MCSGYADLYKAIAQAMGLDAVVIDGYAKGASYAIGSNSEVNHAWNAVKINQGWYLVDATWGAGSLKGKAFDQNFNSYYFATPPNQFIYSHFPSNKTWQLLAKPYAKKQFDSWPEVSPQFFKSHLKLSTHKTHTIQANGKLKILLESPPDVLALSELKSTSTSLDKNYTFTQREGNKIAVYANFPQPGTYELNILSKKKEQQQGSYQHTLKYQVISNDTGEGLPHTSEIFSRNNGYLYSPLKQDLPTNQSVNFKINIPNALDVQVIDTSSKRWTQLRHSGSLFEGKVFVSSGKVEITARFRDKPQYWTLVEYN